jgi:glycerophosphoryl diester phosphodiesterase
MVEIGTRTGPSGRGPGVLRVACGGTRLPPGRRARTAGAKAFDRRPVRRNIDREDNPAAMNFFREGPTRVIGHRGAPTKAVENTVESFDRAEADGADAVELDIRLTLDGEAVVLHDPEVVLGDRRLPIAQLTMADLADTEIARGEFRGRIPTLREVLMRYGSSGRFLVELKPGPSPRPGLLEFRVAALLSQLHLLDRAMVLSFSADMLRRIKEAEPRTETCLNFNASTYRPTGRFWPDRPRGCDAVAPNVSLVTARLMAEAREEGLSVHIWTVNDPDVARQMTVWGAASVITDDPALVGPAVRAVTGARLPLEFVS